MKHYYVYYSYEPWGRGYIGKRECSCLPEEDTSYFGSFYDKTFKPSEKIILSVFDTREDAIAAEVKLHYFYKVDKNPHFANLSRQTSIGFSGGSGFLGFSHSEETREKLSKNSASRRPEVKEKMSLASKGKPKSDTHRLNISLGTKGKKKKPLSEEHKKAISDFNSGKSLSPEHKAKIAKSNKGKPRTETQIQAVIESNKRRKGEKKGKNKHAG